MKYKIIKSQTKGEYLVEKMECELQDKVLLSVEEASDYFGICAAKVRELTDGDYNNLVLWNGSKRMIKRVKMEEYLMNSYSI